MCCNRVVIVLKPERFCRLRLLKAATMEIWGHKQSVSSADASARMQTAEGERRARVQSGS
jgi:hypothetical protein